MELIVQPTNLTLVHNQAPVEVSVDDVVTAGVPAVMELTFAAGAVLGTQLNLQFGDRQVVLPVKAYADAANDKWGSIPTKPGADSLTTYVNEVYYLYLRTHPVLSGLYDISFDSVATITFTARNTGVEYTMTALVAGKDDEGATDSNYNWRGLSVDTVGTADSVTEQRADLEILVEDVMASGNYKPLVQLTGWGDKLNSVKWDLQGNLKSLFGKKFLPDFTVMVAVIYDLTARYRLFFGGVGSFSSQPSYYVAFDSGVKKEDFAKFDDFEADVLGNKFLSWRPGTRQITREEAHWLYFLVNIDRYEYLDGSFDELQLKVTVYFEDGTDTTFSLATEDACQKYGVVGWNVGTGMVAVYDTLETAASSTITHYDVWVNHRVVEDQPGGADVQVSEKITFELVDNDYLDTYYLFRNSFGVFETLRGTGTKESFFNTSKELLRMILEDGYEVSDGESFFGESLFSEKHEVTFQAKSQAEFNWMKELLRSEDAWIKMGEHYIKILIEPGKFMMGQDDNHEYVVTVGYTFANENSKFSII